MFFEPNRRTLALAAAALAACLLAAPGEPAAQAGSRAEQDADLALVKRALAQAPTEERRAERAEPRGRKAEGRWLRVRIHEHGGSKRVSVNLPMAFVRVLDDFPIDYDCGGKERSRRCTLRLAEVLDALDQGEELVRIDSDDASVKVWIE